MGVSLASPQPKISYNTVEEAGGSGETVRLPARTRPPTATWRPSTRQHGADLLPQTGWLVATQACMYACLDTSIKI